tara:strand:+ start:304 stop:618 length:315 start_codon:yes stop_codon:yes gene_type:complete
MKKKSSWVETEIDCGGRIYLLPVRCRVEVKGHLVTTTIQARDHATGKWQTKLRTEPIRLCRAGLLPMDELNKMAEEYADLIVQPLEKVSPHPAWEVTQGTCSEH